MTVLAREKRPEQQIPAGVEYKRLGYSLFIAFSSDRMECRCSYLPLAGGSVLARGDLDQFLAQSNVNIHYGDFWPRHLGEFDVVYAFLSPAPMPALWAKAVREMRPGSLLVSNTFTVPGQEPLLRIPLPGREDACLLVWKF